LGLVLLVAGFVAVTVGTFVVWNIFCLSSLLTVVGFMLLLSGRFFVIGGLVLSVLSFSGRSFIGGRFCGCCISYFYC